MLGPCTHELLLHLHFQLNLIRAVRQFVKL